MKMTVYARIGVIFYVWLIGKDKPPVFQKQIYLVRWRDWEWWLDIRVELKEVLSVALFEFFDKSTYVVIYHPYNPLNHMEWIHYWRGVREILLNIGNVGVIHIWDQISDFKTFFYGNRCEIGFSDICATASEQIYRITGVEILDDKGILAITMG